MNDHKGVFRSVFQFLQILFCQFEALIRGFAPPFCRLDIVLFDAFAVVIALAEFALRRGIPLFGSLAEPFHGLSLVLFNNIAY